MIGAHSRSSIDIGRQSSRLQNSKRPYCLSVPSLAFLYLHPSYENVIQEEAEDAICDGPHDRISDLAGNYMFTSRFCDA